MDALADYGSDDDSDASSSPPAASSAHTDSASATLTSAALLLPHPHPSWISGSKDHLSDTFKLALGSTESLPPTNQQRKRIPPLAEKLRGQKDFCNPKQMEQTVASLHIQDPYATSSSSTAATFAEWECHLLTWKEEQASRERLAQHGSVQASASDFAQDQISQALVGHSRQQ